MSDIGLLRKYNVQGPRYTSYPTVPYWSKDPADPTKWGESVRETFRLSNTDEGISLYIHLPFCESLCTFCGCNTRITINHQVERPYIEALVNEWKLYLKAFGSRPRLREVHLGGGTPTFFSPENLQFLLNSIFETVDITPDHQFGVEGHPNNTTSEHLQTLYDLGFRRVSFGIQDFDPKVQEIIHRIQTFEAVQNVTRVAREIGYDSINYDLLFGLPFQTQDSIRDTMEKVKGLRPDRIAFYSYAHVPWIKPGQRRFTEMDLPLGKDKRDLYELGRELLEAMGYLEIGMDHFALPEDSLSLAFNSGEMHRNFMGYTTAHTQLSVGLGASSIGDSWTGFAQNLKKMEDYLQAVQKGEFPIFRGHFLNEEDLALRTHILDLMCRLETEWEGGHGHPALLEGLDRMGELLADGLVKISDGKLELTPKGMPFVRNVCMALDARLNRNKPGTEIFSSTV